MSREIIKQQFQTILHNQLKDKTPEITTKVYEHLLEIGYEEERAREALAFALENYMHEMLIDKEEFSETKWKHQIEYLMNLNDSGDIRISKHQLERIPNRIKKEFGSILHGNEDDYLEGLNAYESNLLLMANRFQLDSRQLKKIVELWMYMLYGSWHEVSYDFSDVASEDLIGMARIMDNNSNVLHNKDLFELLEKKYSDLDFSLRENLESAFRLSFLLLERIHESIIYWEKVLGSNGYLNYHKKLQQGDYDHLDI